MHTHGPYPPAVRKRCGAPTNRGPCGAFASKASGKCGRHDEARRDQPRALELVRKGLRRDDPLTIKRAIGAALEDVLANRLSPKAAQAVASLVRTWLSAHDRHVLEREIARLSALARESEGVGGAASGYDQGAAAGDFALDGD